MKWNALCYTDQTFKLHYIYTYYFRFGWWVFCFLHTKCIHLQTAAASKISFHFNSFSHRVRFHFNGISFSLHIKLPEICRQLMCIDGLLMEHTKGSKGCIRFRKKVFHFCERNQTTLDMEIPSSSSPWVSSSSKAKKDTEREGGVKIKPWSITPKSEETTLSVTIQPVQCLQKVPAARHWRHNWDK